MPWLCTPRVALSALGLPVPPVHHRLGHGFRRHVMRHWGASHTAAVAAWHCVWIPPAVAAAGGAGWAAARYLPGTWRGVAGGAVAAAVPGVVVSVPEPSALPAFMLALGVLWWIRRRA